MEGTSSSSSSSSLGNFKGVMLCNRPFAGLGKAASAAANSAAKLTAPPPFRSMCAKTEQLGLNPVKQLPTVVIDRSKKDSALSKHRRFLADLKKQRSIMEEEMLRYQKEQLEKREIMREKMRLKREEIVRCRRGEDYNPRGRIESKSNDTSNQEDEKREVLASKPKWALTKEAVEDLEDYEAEDLLDFAKNLDFEEFLHDLDLRAALKAAKTRVDRLRRGQEGEAKETPENVEVASTTTSELRDFLAADGEKISGNENIREAWRKRKEELEKKKWEWNNSISAQEQKASDDEALSVASAKSFLSNSSVKSLKQVHSARSIARVAESLGASVTLKAIQEVAEEAESICPDHSPRVVSIFEDDRTRLTNKTEVYNLPYMHRNPAI